MKIKCLAIANRGEVAVRIIRACEELGIESLLLHSEPDLESRAYRMASKKLCIGPAASSDSYLNIRAVVQGALAGGAQALHPGFGFLSENPDFAKACIDAGLIFVGPPADAMRSLGDKIAFKNLALKMKLPLIPGYQGNDQEPQTLLHEAQKIGFPMIVKAAAGGGGRGMKVIRQASEALEQIESAQREAQSAFGSSLVFLEKYLDRAKHIEIQIFADASGKVHHLFDRECSVQRRHQKIIEEACSPLLPPEMRRKMIEAASLIVSGTGYRGAATVEFLWQGQDFFLLEVNTRLQVEHTVTEMVVGVDLVKAQILTSEAELVFTQPLHPNGHAIECRLYAENSYQGGIPSIGRLGTVKFPDGPGRRFDYGFEEGDTITSYYDSMIAKVIVWDETRSRAIKKMQRVLQDTIVFGVHTNIPYLQKILEHPDFQSGQMTTNFIEKNLSQPLKARIPQGMEIEIIKALRRQQTSPSESSSPFAAEWRIP